MENLELVILILKAAPGIIFSVMVAMAISRKYL